MLNFNLIRRLLFYPFGFFKAIHTFAKSGSRDLNNKIRFKNAIIDDGYFYW